MTSNATPPVSQTTITFTVLHPSDIAVGGIDEAIFLAMDGDGVGMDVDVSTVSVADSEVRAKLIALGNDGVFFDHLIGAEDDEQLDAEVEPSTRNTLRAQRIERMKRGTESTM